MTTNCNDTCDAVDKLLLFYSVQKQLDMWGSIPSSFFYSIIIITLSQKTEMAFVISDFFFSFFFVKASSLRETLRGHLLLNA